MISQHYYFNKFKEFGLKKIDILLLLYSLIEDNIMFISRIVLSSVYIYYLLTITVMIFYNKYNIVQSDISTKLIV